MPTPEQNKQTVSAFAREVFGSKNLDHPNTWLADDFVEHQVFPGTTPDKQGAIDSYRIFFAASPEMTAEIHDMIAAGDRVAIRATYRGPTRAGSSPACPPPAGRHADGFCRYPNVSVSSDGVEGPKALSRR